MARQRQEKMVKQIFRNNKNAKKMGNKKLKMPQLMKYL
jgi:hypothetical protein